jgi:O-antigen ligase
METSTPTINRLLFALCGVAFLVPGLFFAYYTVRLVYINLAATVDEAAAHWTGGMLIGAIAFPLAAVMFGVISWFFLKRARGRAANQ